MEMQVRVDTDMSRSRFEQFLAASAVLLALAAGTALADVDFSIGFGTHIGGCGVYPDYYRYVGIRRPWHWRYRPWWHYRRPVVVAPPVVVRERRVIVEEVERPPAPAPVRRAAPAPLPGHLRARRDELLRALRIGDVGSRSEAVRELEPFAAYPKVRDGLERALLSDREAAVRRAVADLFGRLGDRAPLAALKRAYAEDPDRDVRQAAYRAMILIEGYPLDSP